MVIDFKEIPKANTGEGDQDTFELFARDFLKLRGLEIIDEPARGADGGQDIICNEARHGDFGTTNIKWLISCKHYAHSGKSITPEIEQDISDRVRTFGCQGFMAFYSTISSNGLKDKLDGLRDQFSVVCFDREKIEDEILGATKMETLFIRYFPESYKTWKERYHFLEPVALFNYYLERENIVKPFMEVLGVEASLIKLLRKNPTFEEAIKVTGQLLYVLDSKKNDSFWGLKPTKPSLREIVDDYYAMVLKETKLNSGKEVFLGKAEKISLAGNGLTKVAVKYSNGIVLTETCLDSWNELYEKLRNMLL